MMCLNKSLAPSEKAINIRSWLEYYPSRLLSVSDFIFLLFNKSIFINKECGFDEMRILKGKWSKYYRKLVDNGKIVLFNPASKNLEFRDLLTLINFHGEWNQGNFDDRNALLYCDYFEVPVTFSIDNLLSPSGKEIIQKQLIEGEIAEVASEVFSKIAIPEYSSLISSFGSAFNEFAQIIGTGYEKDFLNKGERISQIIQFDIETEVPSVISNNTSRIIDNLKNELEPIYVSFLDNYKEKVSFEKFVYANLPHENYVDCSPEAFIQFLDFCNIKEVYDSYNKIQNIVTNKENLQKLKESKEEKYSNQIRLNNIICSYIDLGLEVFKAKDDFPSEMNSYPLECLINRRILNNAGWLLSINNFTTSLKGLNKKK